jgi:hypothetical protein
MFILIVKLIEEMLLRLKELLLFDTLLVCISAYCTYYAVQISRAVLTHGSMKIRVIKSVQLNIKI